MKRILFGFIALLAGLILAAPAHANNCLSFDGIDDFVDCTNDPSLQMSTTVTVEAWVFLTRADTYQGIASKLVHEGDREGYSLEIWNSNKLCFLVGCSWNDWCWAESTTPLATDRWYHVAGTYDGSTIRVYIDGELAGSTEYSSGIIDSGSPLIIGSRYGGWPLEGKIDLVRVWSIQRTGEQIADNMNAIVATGISGLVAQYTFDEGVAGGQNYDTTILYDCSGTHPVKDGSGSPVDGILWNFTLDGASSNWVGSSAPQAVEMTGFTATSNAGQVQLAWSTASETNSLNWIIERSASSAGGFSEIGRRPAAGGNATGARYCFTDENVVAGGSYYYRIAEQEQNGKITYYGPVQAMVGIVAPSAILSFRAWPNPFRASIKMQCSAQSKVQVYDLTGRLVRDLNAASGEAIWDGLDRNGQRLGTGVYFLHVNGPNGAATRKITKLE